MGRWRVWPTGTWQSTVRRRGGEGREKEECDGRRVGRVLGGVERVKEGWGRGGLERIKAMLSLCNGIGGHCA